MRVVVHSAGDPFLVAAAFVAASAANAEGDRVKVLLCGRQAGQTLSLMGARVELSSAQTASVLQSCAAAYAAAADAGAAARLLSAAAEGSGGQEQEPLLVVGDAPLPASPSPSPPPSALFFKVARDGAGVSVDAADGARVAHVPCEAGVRTGGAEEARALASRLRLLLDNKDGGGGGGGGSSSGGNSSGGSSSGDRGGGGGLLRGEVLARASAVLAALGLGLPPSAAAAALDGGRAGHLADRFVALCVRFSVAGSSGKEDILSVIARQRRLDVARAEEQCSLARLRERLPAAPPVLDLVGRLQGCQPTAVMAEVKRASPSKGDIAIGIDAAAQAVKYARGGAAAISVLTEPTWFKGSLEDMRRARDAVGKEMGDARPAILRKDFLLEEYQVGLGGG